MLGMQMELLEACEQAAAPGLIARSRKWIYGPALAAKLSSTRSHPGALGTYQESVTQRMQMAAEDGRRMSDECQRSCRICPPAAQRVADRQDLSAFSILPNTRCIAFVQRGQTIPGRSAVAARMSKLRINYAGSDQEDEACKQT